MYDRRARASSTPPALLQCAPSRQGKRAPCQDSGSAQRVSSLGVHHHWNWQTTAHDEELVLGEEKALAPRSRYPQDRGTWATPPPRTAARRPRLATRVRWRATSSRQLLRGNQSSSGEVGGLLCGVRCALLAEPAPALPIVRSASDLPGARQQSGVGLPFGATALNGSARGLPERQVGSMRA
ncbi:unnamed protein product [Prorocentrum cordatum]|uniref:Uncharacterized protein n=1 Tax=Prorocentrum cordatum TaxID=2364126 RepID=A0ABN9RNR6_9DINO|nr:unnamed protein product [Polarella glacialis]